MPIHSGSKRRFAAPQKGFGDCARWPEIVAGRFTAGAEALVVQSHSLDALRPLSGKNTK